MHLGLKTRVLAVAVLGTLGWAGTASASVNWDNGSNTAWWFDPVNWSADNLPPFNSTALDANNKYNGFGADTDINNGYNNTGEGVVFDPAHDPNYDPTSAFAVNRPTGGGTSATDLNFPYSPFGIYRLYLSSGTTATNVLTIKSGTLKVLDANGGTSTGGYAIIGRQGTGVVNQQGGTFIVNNDALDLGQFQNSTAGNGTWNYSGGTLEVGVSGGTSTTGIRLGTGAGSVGTMKIANTGPDGHIRAINITVASGNQTGTFGNMEFHYGVNTHGDGGVRTVQVGNTLTLRNPTGGGSRLNFVLDAQPDAKGIDGNNFAIPEDLGLFDLNFGGLGSGSGPTGAGSSLFYSADGLTALTEGSIISANFGGYTYSWTLSYKGNIDWSSGDAANSLGAVITSDGTGKDLVLVGLSSNQPASNVPEPASLAVLTLGGLGLLARRRKA